VTYLWSGSIGDPTSTNACASKLEQMNRVALCVILFGAGTKREASGSRQRTDVHGDVRPRRPCNALDDRRDARIPVAEQDIAGKEHCGQ